MAFESDFQEFLTTAITHEPYSGQDSYGLPNYKSAVSYSARVMVIAAGSRDARSVGAEGGTKIWVNTTTAFGIEDLITLPSAFTPTQPPISSTSVVYDESGMHHTVILCGYARR
jgi:hypothetical protein